MGTGKICTRGHFCRRVKKKIKQKDVKTNKVKKIRRLVNKKKLLNHRR